MLNGRKSKVEIKNQTKKRFIMEVSKPNGLKQNARSKVLKKKTKKKSNIDRKCKLTIDDELRIIKKTMENESQNDVISKATSKNKDDNDSNLEDEEKTSQFVSKSTALPPPRKRKVISGLENDKELITETISTSATNDEIVVSSSFVNTVNTVLPGGNSSVRKVMASHRDLVTRKTLSNLKNNEAIDAKSLFYKKAISQKAKEVIERSNQLRKQRKLCNLSSSLVATSPENVDEEAKSFQDRSASKNNSLIHNLKVLDKTNPDALRRFEKKPPKTIQHLLTGGSKSVDRNLVRFPKKHILMNKKFSIDEQRKDLTLSIKNKVKKRLKKSQKNSILVDDEVSFKLIEDNVEQSKMSKK